MAFQNMLIQPFQIGMETDIDPHLIPDNAFAELRNVYLYRGRIKKKFGTTYLGRLTRELTAQALGNTAASPFTANIFTVLALTGTIIPGSVSITIAAPVGPLTYIEPATVDGTLDAGGGNTGTINYLTGAITLIHPAAGASAVTIDFTFANSCMGLTQRELVAVNREETIAFDQNSAYQYNTVAGVFNDITPAIGWTGSNSDFFWCWNYWRVGTANLLWVTNNIAADRIRYYAGGGAPGWTTIIPQLDTGAGTRFLWTCRIIVSYRNRLVCLNTTEREGATTVNYQARCRWSKNGNPTTVTNWIDDTPGSGGYIDAPTTERIITAKFVKDTLIVGFERSTWLLKYTGNEILPFIWERINTELGCESTFSAISFDNFLLQTGYRGITAANSHGVERIDLKVPMLIQSIHNDQAGQERVHGIRDFNEQMAYWSYPTASLDGSTYRKIFPDSVIAYNYLEQAFSTFDGHFTCFGYYQPANDLTWAQAGALGYTWENIHLSWNSGQTQAGYPSIIAGNQQGFVSTISQDITNNGISLYIIGASQANPCIITSPNHNLQNDQVIKISNVTGMTELNNNNYFVNNVTQHTFTLYELLPNGTKVAIDSSAYGAFQGAGNIALIDNFKILTKQYNQFISQDSQVRIGIVEFLMQTTPTGVFNLNVYIDQNESDDIGNFTVDTTNPSLPPIVSHKNWQKVYTQTIANYIQFEMSLSDAQIFSDTYNTQNIELSAINLQFSPAGTKGSFA